MNNEPSAAKGVVYFFGNGYEEMALVSIFSLREVGWDGPICIFPIWSQSNPRVTQITRLMAEDRSLDIQLGPPIRAVTTAAPGRTGSVGMVTKTLVPFIAPFRRTFLIDADTIIVRPIDEVFESIAPLGLTAFEQDWHDSPELVKRISEWSDVASERVKRVQSRRDPAINTGVLMFERPAKQLVEWNDLTFRGRHHDIPDEIAMQLLLPELNFDLLPEKWNFSPKYGKNPRDACVWHLHNTDDVQRHKWPQWNAEYLPRLREVKSCNAGKINDWPG
jgi:hypothetical protein